MPKMVDILSQSPVIANHCCHGNEKSDILTSPADEALIKSPDCLKIFPPNNSGPPDGLK